MPPSAILRLTAAAPLVSVFAVMQDSNPSPALKRVMFVSQSQTEAMRPPRATPLISIADPKRQSARLGEGWFSVLRV
jgi:hypothetical protein